MGLVSISDKKSYRKISWSLEVWNCAIALELDTAADAPVKFQSDAIIQTTDLAALRLHEILQ